MKIHNQLLVSLLMMSTTALADMNTMSDFAGSSLRYQEGNPELNIPNDLTDSTVSYSGESAMLPVVTPEMSPGAVPSRLLDLKGLGTLFIIGEDEFSREWLRQNSNELALLNAIGLVVNVTDLSSLQSLRELASGIQLVPAAASEFSQRLRIKHYPVLISDRVMTQKVDEVKAGQIE